MADESGLQNSHAVKGDDLDVVSSKSILLKVVEVVVAVLAIGLIVDPFDSFHRMYKNQTKPKLADVGICYITLCGYVIINTIFIIGHMLGDRMPKRTSVLFSAIGTILHIVAGGVIVHNWRNLTANSFVFNNNILPSKQYSDMLVSGAVFTFANAFVFAVDVFFTIRYF